MTTDAPRVVAYVPDLMDRSKVAAAAEGRVRFVPTPEALVSGLVEADLVVVDLNRPGVMEVLGVVVALGPPVIAFGSHVDRETLAAARSVGCREVLARSAFFSELAAWLS